MNSNFYEDTYQAYLLNRNIAEHQMIKFEAIMDTAPEDELKTLLESIIKAEQRATVCRMCLIQMGIDSGFDKAKEVLSKLMLDKR